MEACVRGRFVVFCDRSPRLLDGMKVLDVCTEDCCDVCIHALSNLSYLLNSTWQINAELSSASYSRLLS